MFGWKDINPVGAFLAALKKTRRESAGVAVKPTVLFRNFVAELFPRLQPAKVAPVQSREVRVTNNPSDFPMHSVGLFNFVDDKKTQKGAR